MIFSFSFRHHKATRPALSGKTANRCLRLTTTGCTSAGVPRKRCVAARICIRFNVPDGTRLTDDFYPDHPHHRISPGCCRRSPWTDYRANPGAGRVSAAVCSLQGPPSRRTPVRDWRLRPAGMMAIAALSKRTWKSSPTGPLTNSGRWIYAPLSGLAYGPGCRLWGTSQGKKGFGGFCFRFAPRDGGSGKTVIRTEKGISKKDDVQRPSMG